MREPLATPGQIVRVRRGGAGGHFDIKEAPALARRLPAAASKVDGRRATKLPGKEAALQDRSESPVAAAQPPAKPARKWPKLSRVALDRAEAAVDSETSAYRAALDGLADREAALKDEKLALRTAHQSRLAQLEKARDKARSDHGRKLKAWADQRCDDSLVIDLRAVR